MLQISYISRQAPGLTIKDFANIRVVSNHNNEKHQVGGELIVFGGLFYQTLRGEEQRVTKLYEKIKQDDRHTDIILLEKKTIEQHTDTSWGMEYLNLDRVNKKPPDKC